MLDLLLQDMVEPVPFALRLPFRIKERCPPSQKTRVERFKAKVEPQNLNPQILSPIPSVEARNPNPSSRNLKPEDSTPNP
jgi:hypothetical protein